MQKQIRLYPRDHEALLEVKLLIEQNLEEMPSIPELCRRAGLNQDKFKKGFKYLFGLPPYSYHISLKMKEAQRLLTETDQTIFEIAYTVGYEHSSNFCIEFKRFAGCPPGDFRKNFQLKGDLPCSC